MVLLPVFRHLLCDVCFASSRPSPTIASLFPYFAIPSSKQLSFLFSSTPKSKPLSKTLPKPQLSPQENTLVLTKDERLGSTVASSDQAPLSSSTIAAIVTSLGGPPGAVGIVRLSGPSAVAIVSCIFRPGVKRKIKKKAFWRPTSHVVEYGLVSDRQGNAIDEVLVVPMLAPRSYTREDVVELQCHGSEVCLRRVLRACLEAGAKLAEPGPLLISFV